MSNTISRRSLLKLMATGAAALATGALFTSCQKKSDDHAPANAPGAAPENPSDTANSPDSAKPKRIVFFFTGTGNCLFVARQLSPNVISIPQALRKNELEYEAEEIGIVYPIYGQMMPNIVRKFLKSAKLKYQYLFAIGTYGNRQGHAVEKCAASGKEAGYEFDYIATLLMVDNWLPRFDMDEQLKIDKKVGPNLSKIMADLNERKKYLEPYVENTNPIPPAQPTSPDAPKPPSPFAEDGIHANAEDWFTITDACISCGLCVRICPRGNYSIDGEIATCKGECELCLACAHACPHKAIVIKSGEVNPKARYRNPNVTMRDIINANTTRN
ncbi:MAG: 4Fe-4S dicluster domain-containing protein [Proteobacteria bacterium]|nr:4Fe-4S dicluster domain-containing protein [Pseudomonadota bacterium]